MKRPMLVLYFFLLIFSIVAIFFPSPSNAIECVGDTTSFPGQCYFFQGNCNPPGQLDGQSTCPWQFDCCVIDPNIPGFLPPDFPDKLGCVANNLIITGGTLNGIDTAIGCIPYEEPNAFVAWILSWALGIAGGVAFLLIVSSGIKLATSSGVPEKIKDARDTLVAALSGLALIIFAVILLRLIGQDILQIPGL